MTVAPAQICACGLRWNDRHLGAVHAPMCVGRPTRTSPLALGAPRLADAGQSESDPTVDPGMCLGGVGLGCTPRIACRPAVARDRLRTIKTRPSSVGRTSRTRCGRLCRSPPVAADRRMFCMRCTSSRAAPSDASSGFRHLRRCQYLRGRHVSGLFSDGVAAARPPRGPPRRHPGRGVALPVRARPSRQRRPRQGPSV